MIARIMAGLLALAATMAGAGEFAYYASTNASIVWTNLYSREYFDAVSERQRATMHGLDGAFEYDGTNWIAITVPQFWTDSDYDDYVPWDWTHPEQLSGIAASTAPYRELSGFWGYTNWVAESTNVLRGTNYVTVYQTNAYPVYITVGLQGKDLFYGQPWTTNHAIAGVTNAVTVVPLGLNWVADYFRNPAQRGTYGRFAAHWNADPTNYAFSHEVLNNGLYKWDPSEAMTRGGYGLTTNLLSGTNTFTHGYWIVQDRLPQTYVMGECWTLPVSNYFVPTNWIAPGLPVVDYRGWHLWGSDYPVYRYVQTGTNVYAGGVDMEFYEVKGFASGKMSELVETSLEVLPATVSTNWTTLSNYVTQLTHFFPSAHIANTGDYIVVAYTNMSWSQGPVSNNVTSPTYQEWLRPTLRGTLRHYDSQRWTIGGGYDSYSNYVWTGTSYVSAAAAQTTAKAGPRQDNNGGVFGGGRVMETVVESIAEVIDDVTNWYWVATIKAAEGQRMDYAPTNISSAADTYFYLRFPTNNVTDDGAGNAPRDFFDNAITVSNWFLYARSNLDGGHVWSNAQTVATWGSTNYPSWPDLGDPGLGGVTTRSVRIMEPDDSIVIRRHDWRSVGLTNGWQYYTPTNLW